MIVPFTPERQKKANSGGPTLIYISKKENKSGERPVISSCADSKTTQQSEEAIHKMTQTSCTEDDITCKATKKDSN